MIYSLNNINIFTYIILSFILSLLIDIIYGEIPTKIHPVVAVGNLISFFKNKLIKFRNRFSGVRLYFIVMIISILIISIILMIVSFNEILFFVIYSIVLTTTYSIKMLLSSAKDIENKLKVDINSARKAMSYLVSRNTETLSESFIISATIETLSENITDSYIAPIFYYMIVSYLLLIFNKSFFILLILIPIIYRITNTLDAMVGYKTNELKYIGYFPAKVDDILNYIPSRIAGLFVILSAYLINLNYKNSYLMYKRDSRNCPSPNSGFTMATVAGALDIQLVKKGTYKLGDPNKKIDISDISKAIKLSKLTITLFTLFFIIIFIILFMVV